MKLLDLIPTLVNELYDEDEVGFTIDASWHIKEMGNNNYLLWDGNKDIHQISIAMDSGSIWADYDGHLSDMARLNTKEIAEYAFHNWSLDVFEKVCESMMQHAVKE